MTDFELFKKLEIFHMQNEWNAKNIKWDDFVCEIREISRAFPQEWVTNILVGIAEDVETKWNGFQNASVGDEIGMN